MFATRSPLVRAALPLDCVVPTATTPSQTAGPYFLAGAPSRRMLREAGIAGPPLALEGRVAAHGCAGIAGARVDLWQADGEGRYDVAGFRLRGHQVTDADGRFAFETVTPGRYPGRTPHVHLRVTPRSGPSLTTQLYFPGAPGNALDSLFRPELVLAFDSRVDAARFTLVLDR